MARWSDIVGDEVAEHCSIETIDDHRLIVQCDSTAWFKQLQLLLPRLERTIAEAVGEGVVQQVILRPPASPSWKKGRFIGARTGSSRYLRLVSERVTGHSLKNGYISRIIPVSDSSS